MGYRPNLIFTFVISCGSNSRPCWLSAVFNRQAARRVVVGLRPI